MAAEMSIQRVDFTFSWKRKKKRREKKSLKRQPKIYSIK